MDIKKLQEYIEANGNIFKNYRVLCEVIGVEPKSGGDQRRAQLKEIEMFIKLSNGKGHKLIVSEIYNASKPKKGNNIYGGLIQLLLTDYFMKTRKSNIQHSKGYLMQQVDMINENYRKNKNNIEKYSTHLDIGKETVYDFYDTTDATLGSAIETALKNLENNALILYTTDYIVKHTNSSKFRIASPMERSVILHTRDKLLKEMGYKTIREVLFSKDQNVYKDKTNRILKEEINIERVFKGYNINILQERIAEKQSLMIISHLTEVESQGYKDELNSLVVNRLLVNAIRRHESVVELRREEQSKRQESNAFGEISSIDRFSGKQKSRELKSYTESIKKMIDDNIDNIYVGKDVGKISLDDTTKETIENIFKK